MSGETFYIIFYIISYRNLLLNNIEYTNSLLIRYFFFI